MKIHVKCNGKQQEWDVTPNEYLADTLRSHGCPSVKISCGDGACGSNYFHAGGFRRGNNCGG